MSRTAAIAENSGPMMYIGGGPWRVLDECPAQWHNTQRAALGRSRNGPQSCCICPQGLALAQRARELRAIGQQGGRRDRRAKTVEHLDQVAAHVAEGAVQAPDLRYAACRTEDGRRLADEVSVKPLRPGAIREHRELCSHCPVRLKCGAWAVASEDTDPNFGWGGMWGGMMFAERQKVRRRLAAVKS